jgi:prevent-host-death family protein
MAEARWQVQEAKQKFSELLRKVHSEGPQFVTRHGEEVAVVVDIEEFRHLKAPKKSLAEFLLEMPRVGDIPIPARRVFEREIPFSDL